tara:strand:- start:447 stop:590 length:144 start_codon:yes stop_codon:yes gene_type:complete
MTLPLICVHLRQKKYKKIKNIIIAITAEQLMVDILPHEKAIKKPCEK